jgi:hypothetical protein
MTAFDIYVYANQFNGRRRHQNTTDTDKDSSAPTMTRRPKHKSPAVPSRSTKIHANSRTGFGEL